jgi:phosphatidylglycerophosphate synthase
MQSVWGGILDPLADKIFVASIGAGLVMKGLLPYELLAIFLGRDIFLVSGGLIMRALEKAPESEFFDIKTATFEIVPTNLSKVCTLRIYLTTLLTSRQGNTALQFILLGATLSNYYTDGSVPPLDQLQPLWYLTGLTTVASGLQYVNGSGMKKLDAQYAGRKKRFTWD